MDEHPLPQVTERVVEKVGSIVVNHTVFRVDFTVVISSLGYANRVTLNNLKYRRREGVE